MPNPNKKIGPKARTTKSRMGKRALMQVDPMTGMPVAQPGSTPMFPVSEGANAGSTDKFNPLMNQYAMADPLANAAYASSPMPALAQTMSLEEKVRTLLPKEGSIGTPAPTKGVKTEVIKPKMSMEMKSKPLPADTATKTYNVMMEGRRLEKLLSQAPDAGINIMKGKAAGGTLKQKPIPKDAIGLQELAASGPKGEDAVENMGYNPNALARMRNNGMYQKNRGYKK